VKDKNAKQTVSSAVRSGDFKYIRSDSKGGKQEEFLYNIRQDAKESHNLINDDSFKSTLQDLKAKLDKWSKENPLKY
jgi:hypothetical protein